LELSNGYDSYGGGAIWVENAGSMLTMSSCTLSSNTAENVCALLRVVQLSPPGTNPREGRADATHYLGADQLKGDFRNCRLLLCAQAGGALVVDEGARATISNSEMHHNYVVEGFGGVAYIQIGGELTVDTCTLWSNTAEVFPPLQSENVSFRNFAP